MKNNLETRVKTYLTKILSFILYKNPNFKFDDEFVKDIKEIISEELNNNCRIQYGDNEESGVIINLDSNVLNTNEITTVILTDNKIYYAGNIRPVYTYTTADDITFTSAVSHHLDRSALV